MIAPRGCIDMRNCERNHVRFLEIFSDYEQIFKEVEIPAPPPCGDGGAGGVILLLGGGRTHSKCLLCVFGFLEPHSIPVLYLDPLDPDVYFVSGQCSAQPRQPEGASAQYLRFRSRNHSLKGIWDQRP